MLRSSIARIAVAAVLVAPALGACADSTTSANGGTISSVTLNDNPSSATSTGATSGSDGSYTGTLTGTAQVQVSTDAQSWVNVGDPASVSIALQSTGSVTTLGASARVPAGTYAYVRLVFDPGAQATVTGNVGGTNYNGQVVALGSGQVIIQKQVSPREISAGSSFSVVWDLNSELWLTSTTLQAHAVTAAAVQSASWASIQ